MGRQKGFDFFKQLFKPLRKQDIDHNGDNNRTE